MQDNAADKLHRVMLHIQHTPRRLADRRKRLGQDIVQRLAFFQTLFEFSGVVF